MFRVIGTLTFLLSRITMTPAAARVSLTDLDTKLDTLLARPDTLAVERLVSLVNLGVRGRRCSGSFVAFRRDDQETELGVPDGHVLLLTHISYEGRPLIDIPAGGSSRLALVTLTGSVGRTLRTISSAPFAATTSASTGGSVSLQTPIVVSAGETLCARTVFDSEAGLLVGSRFTVGFLNSTVVPIEAAF